MPSPDKDKKPIVDVRHPSYIVDEMYWQEWRDCYDGGPWYVQRNLKKFSERETDEDFRVRKFFTPIPTFAKGAINDIRNSIFQRLSDVIRRDGSRTYMRASAGEDGGVDNKGSTMQSFFGIEVLTELLVMGRVGVYVDMPQIEGEALSDVGDARPYVYHYKVEDILSWVPRKPEDPGEFSAILLRDQGISYNRSTGLGVALPDGDYTRYRFMWIDPKTEKVHMKLFNEDSLPINFDGYPTIDDPVVLNLERIPFTVLDIGGSLLKDVYKHQTALLNLGSSDVSYALKANFPFYTEQKDMRNVGEHLKMNVSDEGTTVTSDNTRPGNEVRVGAAQGRAYDLKAERPGFIHPSPEPLMASLKLQEKLEDDIRKLVNLAVQNKMGQRAISAEAMKLSDQGLEAGLSYIGLVMEGAERKVAQFWAAYENSNSFLQQIATVKYPDRYSLKDDVDRIKEAHELASLMYAVPGKTVKQELSKNIVTVLLSGKVDSDTIDTIFTEISNSDYTTSNPDTIIRAHEAGLVGEQTASVALGFNENEYLQARADHIDRATRILEAQSEVALKAKLAEAEAGALGNEEVEGTVELPENAGARGVTDLAVNTDEGVQERQEAVDRTLEADKERPVRGEGRELEKEEE
jgi:hypothetical protein